MSTQHNVVSKTLSKLRNVAGTAFLKAIGCIIFVLRTREKKAAPNFAAIRLRDGAQVSRTARPQVSILRAFGGPFVTLNTFWGVL